MTFSIDQLPDHRGDHRDGFDRAAAGLYPRRASFLSSALAWMALGGLAPVTTAMAQDTEQSQADPAAASAAEPASPSEGSAPSSSGDGAEDLDLLLEPESAPPASEAGAADSAKSRPEALEVIPVAGPQAETAPAAAKRPRSPALEEIIVTAQRREQNLQDVPISITVFKPEDLANANITNAADLASYTPSLSTNQRFGTENASFSIRGFTQDLRTTASVGSYFAEVIAPRGQNVQNSGDGSGPGPFFDLANVQVLKGPQGTLFGRNTTGGAVLLVPRKPTDEFEGYVELSTGNFGAKRQQAVFNAPLHERVRLRFAVDNNDRDGHLNNYTGIGADDLGNVNYTAYRLSGVVDITDTIANYTILTYVDSESHGNTSSLFRCNADRAQAPLSALTGPACERQLTEARATGNDGFYDLASSAKTPSTVIEEKRLINTATWQITDQLTLKNILAYAHLYTENTSTIFGTHFKESPTAVTAPGVPAADPRREFFPGTSFTNPDQPVTSQETYVAELQLQGQALDDRLDWQTGIYHENSKPDGASGPTGAVLISCDPATMEGDPAQYNCFDVTGGALGSVQTYQFKTEYLNQAVYAQGTYDILEQLSVTAGLRYTWDETEGKGRTIVRRFEFTVPRPPTVIDNREIAKSKAPTGVLELSYRPTDTVMTYAKYLRGYRQGSVNLAADPGVQTWDPEQVDTYEIGAKTEFEWLLPTRFNVAVFHNEFTDMQLQIGYVSPDAGPTTAIFNAGKARISGAEIEAFVDFTERLNATLSYAYLDTQLLEQQDRRAELRAAGGPLAERTYSPSTDEGDTLPFAADHTGVVSLKYRLPFSPDLGNVDVGATYVYTGVRRSVASSVTDNDEMEPFELLNLNASWARIYGSALDLNLFATNVLDEEYEGYVSGTWKSLGFESRQVGLPRMVGARLRYNFGAAAE